MILGLLQNAWSPLYAGSTWPRKSWLKALWQSRSGQRLKVMQEGCVDEIWWDNTTPIVGDNPNSVVKPSKTHVESLLFNKDIDTIVTFGKQAEKIILEIAPLHKKHLILPHPACRVVTNKCFINATSLLNFGFEGRLSINYKGDMQ